MISKFALILLIFNNILMIENVLTQLTVFHCLCPLPASRKGLRPPLRSALFGEGGSDWRPWESGKSSRDEENSLDLITVVISKQRFFQHRFWPF